MRFLIKLFLFPITLALTILVAACRLLCQLSTMVLGIVAFVCFAIALGTMVLLQDFPEGLRLMVLAWLISPFGLPLIAAFLVELLGVFNDSLKAI
ncbi:CD1845 family protein [Proteiniclasticum sp.]|uniref:CD1845 family protein n=1 Tax=Proteiniclasticum sp. TaxID=2053595 RepID=UPI00289870CA|nr:CD1845 family protein [Proteiniclasticum sp.]